MAVNVLTKDELKTLAGPHEGYCISIYMPTFEKSQEVRQNFIRYKNLLDDVVEQLKKLGMENQHIQEYIAPAQSLIDEEPFWENQDQGLAVFLSKDVFQRYQLSEVVDEIAVVNERFYLKPLLGMLYKGGEFYILALSQNEARLIKATENTAEEVEVPNMPKSMEEALPDIASENDVSFHTNTSEPRGASQGGNIRAAMYFGYGRGEEDKKRNISRYFHKVDDAVAAYLGTSQSPLIVAGVEYIQPIYREANSYEHFVDDIIPGNQDGVRAEQLRDQAWPKVEPLFHDAIDNIVGRYRQLSGGKDRRATRDLKEVVKAAPYSRVEVLFVNKNAKKWGKFDPENLDVKFEDQQSPENEDLIDFAAVQTLLNGGTVYVVEPEKMPDQGSPVAAIFRY